MQHLPTKQFSSMCGARFWTTRQGFCTGFAIICPLFPSKLAISLPQGSHAEVSRYVWDLRYGDSAREDMFITSCGGPFHDRRQHTSRVTFHGNSKKTSHVDYG